MRLRLLLLILFIPAVTYAQSAGTVRLSGFELENPQTANGPYQQAYGGEAEYFVSKNFSAAVAMSSERTVVTRLVPGGLGVIPQADYERLHPIDVLVRYHFAGSAHFRPWIGGGTRDIRVAGHNNVREIVNAGSTIALTKHLGIDLEAKRLYGRRKPDYAGTSIKVHDGDFDEGRSRRLSAGLSWTF
jgi:outer membrane protein W